MKEFHGTIQNGKLTLPSVQREQREKYLTSLKNGSRIKETLTKESRAGTYQQAKAHFGLVVEMVRQRMIEMGFDIYGVPPNKLIIHDILKKACGGVGDMGENIGFSEMSAAQRSQFFGNCRTWCATQLQLVIPDPDPAWREKKTNEHRKT